MSNCRCKKRNQWFKIWIDLHEVPFNEILNEKVKIMLWKIYKSIATKNSLRYSATDFLGIEWHFIQSLSRGKTDGRWAEEK